MVQKYIHRRLEEAFSEHKTEEYDTKGKTIVVPKIFPRFLYDSKLTIDGQDILYCVNEDPDFKQVINVPGVIINYRARDNGYGLLESDVEPIADKGLMAKVEMALKDIPRKGPINFWS